MANREDLSLMIYVQHAVEDAVKEAVRLAVRNALTEATTGLEQRIVDNLSRPRIETKVEPDGSRSVRIAFKAVVDVDV